MIFITAGASKQSDCMVDATWGYYDDGLGVTNFSFKDNVIYPDPIIDTAKNLLYYTYLANDYQFHLLTVITRWYYQIPTVILSGFSITILSSTIINCIWISWKDSRQPGSS